ncbi:Gfo/Idh/MocA family oxidoreductase [soil metagenome]
MSSRRTFLKTSVATVATSTLAAAAPVAKVIGGDDTLKIGLVGCGGRGRGAAADAMQADPKTKIVAVCDVFPDVVQPAAAELSKRWKDRADIGTRIYDGFDGYKKLIDEGGCDVVLLVTPPGFRPAQLDYAVKAGKHVFAEKPLAVDAAGVRSVIESAKLAKEKNLMCASGFCFRHDSRKMETVKRIKEGAIGDVVTMHVSYNTGLLWHRGDKPTWTPMEKQVRNWYYYTWLSGDHLVEQHCHNIDKAAWVMGEYPIAATALGGRQMRTDPKWGNIWDHFAIVYEFSGGRKVFSQCRQMSNCHGDVSDHVFGTKGQAYLNGTPETEHTMTFADGKSWKYEGPYRDMYVQEHMDFYQALRAGKPFNDMEDAGKSTLMAIMGRQAAYTGKRITWKQMLDSKESLVPTELAWGEHPVPPVAVPGVTKFV